MSATAAPILAPSTPGPLQVAWGLWRAQGSFRGFVEFAVIGAVVLCFLNTPTVSMLGAALSPFQKKLAEDAATKKASSPALPPISFKNKSGAAPRLNEIKLDTSYFDSEPEPLRSKLSEALTSYRKRSYHAALSVLNWAPQDHPKAMLLRGLASMALIGDGNFNVGMNLLRKSAELGDSKAMSFLGIMTMNGLPGLSKNVEEGRALLEKAARAGEADALRVLGQGYVTGWSGSIDPARAAGLLREASDRGDMKATFALAELYFTGLGTNRDHKEAERLMRSAAATGHAEAQAMLGSWLIIPYGSGTTDDPSEALGWLERAAAQNEPHAMLYLGMFYVEFGSRIGLVDQPRGVSYFRRCAELTLDSECAFAYATGLHYGMGTARDLPKAYAFYTIASVGVTAIKSAARLSVIKPELSPEELLQANGMIATIRGQKGKGDRPIVPQIQCSFGSKDPC